MARWFVYDGLVLSSGNEGRNVEGLVSTFGRGRTCLLLFFTNLLHGPLWVSLIMAQRISA